MKQSPGPKIIHSLRYRDASAAIDFLRRGFGFEEHLVVPGEGESITHAQLVGHGGMIMLGSYGGHGGEYDRHTIHPDATRNRSTASAYIVVEDVKAHCDRARRAGARIVMEPVEQDYGGWGYSCLDPEGHLWSFGDYDPCGDALSTA